MLLIIQLFSIYFEIVANIKTPHEAGSVFQVVLRLGPPGLCPWGLVMKVYYIRYCQMKIALVYDRVNKWGGAGEGSFSPA